MQTIKKERIERLRKEVLCLQGLNARPESGRPSIALGPLLENMPGKIFPTGAIHEFLSPAPTASAATTGFISALLNTLMEDGKCCIWISTHRNLFPPGLKAFGIAPDRIIFIDAAGEKEALWAIEEALKCKSIAAVVGEIKELDFTHSRRLQLAVEHSRVTGFIHRIYPRHIRPTACVARWQIQPVNSQTTGGVPGVGFPRWEVELIKIRNGKPGRWQLTWTRNNFHLAKRGQEMSLSTLKTGTA